MIHTVYNYSSSKPQSYSFRTYLDDKLKFIINKISIILEKAFSYLGLRSKENKIFNKNYVLLGVASLATIFFLYYFRSSIPKINFYKPKMPSYEMHNYGSYSKKPKTPNPEKPKASNLKKSEIPNPEKPKASNLKKPSYGYFSDKEYCQPVNSKILNEVDSVELEVNNYFTKVRRGVSIVDPTEYEYLKLCKNGKKKVLWLTAKNNHNGFLSPSDSFHLIYPFIDAGFDFKFETISSINGMCKEIRNAARIGVLYNVIISADGNAGELFLGETSTDESLLVYNKYSKKFLKRITDRPSIDITSRIEKCFVGVSKMGRILLLSPLTGADVNGNYENSLAAGLARTTKRQVVSLGATLSNSYTYIISTDPIKVTYPFALNCFQVIPNIEKVKRCLINLNENLIRYFNENGQLQNNINFDLKNFFKEFMLNLSILDSLFRRWNAVVAINLLNRASIIGIQILSIKILMIQI
jgi:hypothetical protein